MASSRLSASLLRMLPLLGWAHGMPSLCPHKLAESALFAPASCSLAPGLDALSGATGLWEVRLAPGRGRGVFALADLPRGTPILAEDPLLSVALPAATAQGYDLAAMTRGLARAFARLGPAAQEEFLSCHGQRFEGDGDDEAGRLMVILRSNGYTLEDARGGGGGRRVALYPKVALINHSCEPNVLNADEGGTRKVVAARDIMAGEEILTTYIPLLMDTNDRNQRLHQYGFQCDCDACQTRASDYQRVLAGDDLRVLENALATPSAGDEEGLLERAESLARYIEDEGFADYLVKTSRLAFEYATRADDQDRVREWSAKHQQNIAAAQA